MKKLLMLLCAVMLVFGMVGIGSAAPFTYNMGAGSSVDTSGTSSALAMYANVNSNLDNISFTLDDGDSFSFFFATIGTSESWINGDDLNTGTLTAYVDFDSPDIISTVGGTTIGFSGGIFQRVQGWDLVWYDPVVVSFGGGGQFAINLSDAHFQNNVWGGA